jgi:hypothetical protein
MKMHAIHGSARVIISPPKQVNGKIFMGYCGGTRKFQGATGMRRVYRREQTGMHRLLVLCRSLQAFDYAVEWDFAGDQPVAFITWKSR